MMATDSEVSRVLELHQTTDITPFHAVELCLALMFERGQDADETLAGSLAKQIEQLAGMTSAQRGTAWRLWRDGWDGTWDELVAAGETLGESDD
jgi:hypothetical protein